MTAQTPLVGLLRTLVDIFIDLGVPTPMAWFFTSIVVVGFVGLVLIALREGLSQ